MKTPLRCALAALVSFFLCTSANAAILFTEDFDSKDIGRGWGVYDTAGQFVTTGGDGIELQRSVVVNAESGRQYVELDSHGGRSNSSMAALVGLTAGEEYKVSFSYRPRTNNADDNGIAIAVGSLDGRDFARSQELGNVDGKKSTQNQWQTVSFVFTAMQTDNAVQFSALGRGNGLGGFIDSIQIESMAGDVTETPLPGGAVLLATGLGLAWRFCRAKS